MSRTITKTELIERVSFLVEQEEPQITRQYVQAVLDAVSDYLVEGNRIELRNFGVFSVKERKSRIGRNPNKPSEPIEIPSISVPCFKAGKVLKQRVKNYNK